MNLEQAYNQLLSTVGPSYLKAWESSGLAPTGAFPEDPAKAKETLVALLWFNQGWTSAIEYCNKLAWEDHRNRLY